MTTDAKTAAASALLKGLMAVLALVALALLLIGVFGQLWGLAIAGAVVGGVALVVGLAGLFLQALKR